MIKKYPPQSSGSALSANVPTAKPDATALQILDKISGQNPSFDSISYTYVLSDSGKLKGVVAIKSLLRAAKSQKLKSIMTTELVSVHPYTDQEKAAIMAIQNNIKAIPVVDKDNVFLGAIVTDKILSTLHEEHIEDILKLSGINVENLNSSQAKQKAFALLRMRIPWLIIGLIGSLFSTWIVSRYNLTLQNLLSLTFFMPLVVYLSGAISNQTLSLQIRNSIITHLNLRTFYLKELTSGTLLGLIFACIVGLTSYLWLGNPVISFIVSLTLLIDAAVSTTVSAFVPYFLIKLKKDPALAAGPFAIILQDTLNLTIYLTIATIFINF